MTTTSTIASSVRAIHLIETDGSPPRRVAVPEGLSRLVPGNGTRPARCEPARAAGSRPPASCLVEPIDPGTGSALLVLSPDEKRFRVNGQRLARIATVGESDTIQLDGGQTFHVAVHTRCELGLAPEARRDERCPVCRQPLGEHVVYLCAACGAAVHSDEQPVNGAEPLECLSLLSDCPRCHAPLIRDGYARMPEGLP